MRISELQGISNPIGTIIAVAKLHANREQGSIAKMDMSEFTQELSNAGIQVSYSDFAAMHEKSPELQKVIANFNEKEIQFAGTGEEEDSEGLTEPEQGTVPPEEKVKDMATQASAKRESVDEDDEYGFQRWEDEPEGYEQEESPVYQAILHRILRQHTNVIGQFGPEEVMDAVQDVADYVGDVDEIGSSDVSIWTNEVLQQLQGGYGESVDEAYISKYHDDDAGPKEKTLRARSEPWEKKVQADMDAGEDAGWFLDRDKGAGQKWTTGTQLWFDVEKYQKERGRPINRIKRLAGL